MEAPPRTILRRLKQLGYHEAATLLKEFDPRGFAKLVRKYQRRHHLKPDGQIGSITRRHLELPRICGVAEQLNLGRTCKWPMKTVSLAVASSVPGMSLSTRKDILWQAAQRWNGLSGFEWVWSTNPKTAHVLVHGVKLDGPSGVLADMQLPCGARANTQLRGRTDTSERWKVYDGPGTPGELDLTRTDAHELGHAMGIPHIDAGNLMQALWDRNIWMPQAGDVAFLVKLYGRPKNPQPQPQPQPPSGPVGTGEPDRVQVLTVKWLGQPPFSITH